MADVEIIETYSNYCHDCGWESDVYEFLSDAKVTAYAHKCGGLFS